MLFLLTASAASARTQVRAFVFEGRGWGHGLGMSQWGAEGFALHDWRYREILAHYYPGTTLDRVAGRTVRVLLVEKAPSVRISSRTAFKATWHGHTRVRHRTFTVTPRTGVAFITHGGSPLSVDGAGYRGELQVFPNGGGVAVVNVVSLERYLRGVVPWEMPHRWQPQALAAQAQKRAASAVRPSSARAAASAPIHSAAMRRSLRSRASQSASARSCRASAGSSAAHRRTRARLPSASELIHVSFTARARTSASSSCAVARS